AGNGALMLNFKKIYGKKKEITAIDISPKRKDIKKGSCTNLKFKDNLFDTIFLTDVIEHLSDKDIKKALNEIRRVLNEEGTFVLTTIEERDLTQNSVKCPDCGCVFHHWGHCQLFTRKRLSDLLKKNGFEIIDLRLFNIDLMATFGPLASLFYLLRLNRVFKYHFFNRDIFAVARKSKSLKSN
ncbi:hypothetical protein COT47_01735, partial [Candidatus Woesearchaeota archaeon CG08_land_8_20_14_0_20_43_7]